MKSSNINRGKYQQQQQLKPTTRTRPTSRSTIEQILLVVCLVGTASSLNVENVTTLCKTGKCATNNIPTNAMDPNNTNALIHKVATLIMECRTSSRADCISNGQLVVDSQFPWMALLEYEDKITFKRIFWCIGSLISDHYVLTAGFCAFPPNLKLISVLLGDHDIKKEKDCKHYESDTFNCAPPFLYHLIDHVILHNDFKPDSFANNIALIKLQIPISFDNHIRPICLPVSQSLINSLESATVAGWTNKRNGPLILEKAELSMLPNKYCGEFFKDNLTSANICAGGRGLKPGRGQPLFAVDGSFSTKYVLYGITFSRYKYCGESNVALNIYTNVTNYIPWIIENIRL